MRTLIRIITGRAARRRRTQLADPFEDALQLRRRQQAIRRSLAQVRAERTQAGA